MFVGRKHELEGLESLYSDGKFQMVVIYGRRRVGKTSLIQEFGKDKDFLYFTALDQSDKDNLADFSRKIWDFFDIAGAGTFESWSAAFDYLAGQAATRRFVLVFDELPYAAKRNPSLPSVIQIAIDHKLKGTNLFLILCGSNQGYMESDVLGRESPLYGRRTAQIKLEQLGYRDAAKMLPDLDAQEQFRYYGCFGGVPYYLEQVKRDLTLTENLARLYFDTMGFLYDEPYGLLRQELREPALYNSILRAIASGANKPNLIADRTGIEKTTLPKYLKTLVSLDIAERVVPFGENPETSKKALYRIKDTCYDFWFTFVMPRVSDIEQGFGPSLASNIVESRLDEYLGRRFERLCAEWVIDQAKPGMLPVRATRVGSWWGTNPAKHEQDDIDLVAADPDSRQLLIGECKYRNAFDETEIIARLEGKRSLVSGYEATHMALFTKHPVSEATRRKSTDAENLLFVALEEMYTG